MRRRTLRLGRVSAATLLAVLTGACASQAPAPNPAPTAPAPLAPTATPTPRPPAARVPDQPFVGTPRPVEQPYIEIMRLKSRGQTNEQLLAKVRAENVVYTLDLRHPETPRGRDLRGGHRGDARLRPPGPDADGDSRGGVDAYAACVLTEAGPAAPWRRFHQSRTSHTEGMTASA